MVRVAGMHEYVDAGIVRPREDGRHAGRDRRGDRGARPRPDAPAVRLPRRRPAARAGRARHPHPPLRRGRRGRARAELDERFQRQIFPVLTPLAVGLGRPFPYISNLSLSLAVLVRDPETEQETFARVKVPKEMLPRFVPIGDGRTFVPLEDLIAQHLDALFPGMEIIDRDVFRVTRDADFEIDDEADDLLRAVEQELRRRRFGEVVRLEVGSGMSEALREPLLRALELDDSDVYEVDGLLDLKDLWDVVKRPRLREAARPPVDARHAAAAPAVGGRGARRDRRDAQRRHPRPPPLRLVLDVRRALHRAGGGRPGRARDQADRVPHERRLAARPGADPRGRARQAGGLPRGAQGPLRRAREHRLGARAGAGGRARRLRPARR